MRGFGGARGGFRFGKRGLRGFERRGQRRQIGLAAAGRGEAGFDLGDLGLRAAQLRCSCSRSAVCSWLRCAVRSASAVVSSAKDFSEAESAASASATRASTPLRRPALSCASA